MKKTMFLLSIVFALGLLLRLFRLDIRPLGFTWDEAALGYNAYSLLLTGRDEYQVKMPVILKSFGDYKPGLYAYLAVAPIKLFGLNEFATRVPSAIFGSLLIVCLFIVVSRLYNFRIGLLASALLAINPWAIHFSRGAWESNVSLCLATLGVALFLSKKNYLAFLFWGLTLWTYQGAKMFTPLLVIATIALFWPKVKSLVFPGIVFLVFAMPIVLNFSAQSGRLNVLSVFSYTRKPTEVTKIMSQDSLISPNLFFNLFHAEKIDQFKGVLQRFLNHLSPRYLFIDGDWSNVRHSTPFYGYFHIVEVISVLLGLVVLLKSKSKSTYLILCWAIFAILPASLSRDIISGVRSLPLVIPTTIISALGLSKILKIKVIGAAYLFVLVFFFTYYLDLYYVHSPSYSADAWLYPYKQAIALLNNNINSFQHVKFTSKLGQPYIFVLFYNHVDPRKYQPWASLTANSSGDVGEVAHWDKYTFGPIFWPAERGGTSTIFIGDQYDLPEKDLNPANLVRLGEIYYPNGAHALRLVGLK